MQRLEKLAKLMARDEHGAYAVLVALLMVPLMGVGALALDMSAQHAERTQLQHGADAAALAIARSCGLDDATCEGTAKEIGDAYIADNQGSPVQGEAEPPLFNWSKRQVTVVAGANFPHFLASLIDSDEDPNNTKIRAEATAEWEVGTAATVVPFAIGECTVPSGTGTVAFIPIDNDPCSGSVPGGFGWLDDGTESCIKDVTLLEFTTITTGDTGKCELTEEELAGAAAQLGCSLASVPNKYKTPVEKLFYCFLGRTVLVPVYSLASECPTEPPAGKAYCISKFAAFEVIGLHVKLTTGDKVDECMPTATCSLPKDWGSLGFEGRFISYVTPDDSWMLGPPKPVIRLIG